MRLKKWAAVPLVMTLLFSSVAVTMAADTVQTTTTADQDQALHKVKQAFGIGDDFKLVGVQTSDNRGNPNPIWTFMFQKDEFAHHTNQSIVVDSKTLEILHFDRYEETPDKSGTYTKEAAHEKALALIAKLQPEKAKQVEEVPVVNNFDYMPDNAAFAFRFVRKVNGVLFPSNGFTVNLDAKGNVTMYDFSWSVTDDQFPKAEGLIDKDKASTLFMEQNPLKLRYQTSYLPGDNTAQVHLIYQNGDVYDAGANRPYMDAQTGKMINTFGEEVPQQGPLTPIADQAGPAPTSHELDKEAALAMGKSYVQLDDSYTLQNSGMDAHGDQKVWNFTWTKGDPMQGNQVSVVLDGKTGELLNYYAMNGNNMGKTDTPSTPQFSWTELRDKAIAFVKKAAPTKLNSYTLLTTEQSASYEYYGKSARMFTFGRLVNGVLEDGRQMSVTVDDQTGAITQFSGAYGVMLSNDSYPDPKQAMSAEAAEEKYLTKYPLQLIYMQTYEKGSWNPYGGSNNPSKVVLAYVPWGAETGFNLDAVSGDWLKANGAPAESKTVNDIKGHWAQKQLQDLVDHSVYKLDADNNVHPDATITRAEAIRVLVMTVGENRVSTKSGSTYNDVAVTDPNHDYIETAVFLGWLPNDIKEFHPNDALTREELAKWSTTILGYGKLTSKKNVFMKPFTDLTAQDDAYLGSISVVNALGVMQGNGGKFNPHGNVTKAQMAVVANRLIEEYKSMPHSMF